MLKKKVLALTCTVGLLISGVVGASSINGEFNGNPIVKVKSNGQVLPVEDTPAIIYEGRTLVPIYMLKQLGADVTWNQDTYSVDVKLPSKYDDGNNIVNISKEVKKYDVEYVYYVSDGESMNIISYRYKYTLDKLFANTAAFDAVMTSSISTEAEITEITDSNGGEFSVPTKAFRDFKQSKITADELSKQYKVVNRSQNTSSNETQLPNNNQSSNNDSSNISPQPTQQPAVNNNNQQAASNNNNSTVCQNLQDQYILDKAAAERSDTANPFSGKKTYFMEQFERNWSIRFSEAGC